MHIHCKVMLESLCSSTNLKEGRDLKVLQESIGLKYPILGFSGFATGPTPSGQIQPAHLSLKAFLGERETQLLLGGTQKR